MILLFIVMMKWGVKYILFWYFQHTDAVLANELLQRPVTPSQRRATDTHPTGNQYDFYFVFNILI